MENTMNTKQEMIVTFKNLYKKAYDEWKKGIRYGWKNTQEEAYNSMQTIAEMYVKVVFGKTYLTCEMDILENVRCNKFVELQTKFTDECEKEYEEEKYNKSVNIIY